MADKEFSLELLNSNFSNLDDDIVKIDVKLSEIEQLLLDLKNTVNRAQSTIKSSTPQDKKSIYQLITNSMELLANFYQTHQRFLDLKFKYRKEQDDLTYKAAHMTQIELTKINKDTDTSYMGVIELLKTLSSVSNQNTPELPPEVQSELSDIENDDLYSMK